MPDRIASDHPTVETHRVEVRRHGGRRRRLNLPDGVLPVEEPVRISIDGTTSYGMARATPGRDGAMLPGAYASPDAARDPGGAEDTLAIWLDEHDASPGESVLLDVIEPGVAYGLRRPGERAVYDAVDPPASSLQAIARDLEDRD